MSNEPNFSQVFKKVHYNKKRVFYNKTQTQNK